MLQRIHPGFHPLSKQVKLPLIFYAMVYALLHPSRALPSSLLNTNAQITIHENAPSHTHIHTLTHAYAVLAFFILSFSHSLPSLFFLFMSCSLLIPYTKTNVAGWVRPTEDLWPLHLYPSTPCANQTQSMGVNTFQGASPSAPSGPKRFPHSAVSSLSVNSAQQPLSSLCIVSDLRLAKIPSWMEVLTETEELYLQMRGLRVKQTYVVMLIDFTLGEMWKGKMLSLKLFIREYSKR